jgi:serine/threonine protein kinase
MSPNFLPGARLGRYEIKSQLGAGGMGEVYLAPDAKLDRKVALRILPSDLAANQDRMRRFVQEAKADWTGKTRRLSGLKKTLTSVRSMPAPTRSNRHSTVYAKTHI